MASAVARCALATTGGCYRVACEAAEEEEREEEEEVAHPPLQRAAAPTWLQGRPPLQVAPPAATIVQQDAAGIPPPAAAAAPPTAAIPASSPPGGCRASCCQRPLPGGPGAALRRPAGPDRGGARGAGRAGRGGAGALPFAVSQVSEYLSNSSAVCAESWRCGCGKPCICVCGGGSEWAPRAAQRRRGLSFAWLRSRPLRVSLIHP